MIIQFNTDHNIHGHEALEAKFTTILIEALNRFSKQMTRIEVHLSDENNNKNKMNHKRCLLEARLEGLQPFVASDDAENHELALKGAINKLKTVLDTKIGHLRNH